jgi:hypothetical protein
MGALLESGLVGNIGLKHLKVIKEDTINKWDKLGFLEGLKGHLRENVAQLYENQASFLINEATSDGSSGSFETVVFPIVRRVFSKLLANDIVSVQAMNLPIGKLFYFVPKIQGYQGGIAGQYSGEHYAPVGAPGNYNEGTLPSPGNGPNQGGNPNAGYTTGTGTYNPVYEKNLYDLFYEGNEAQLDPPGLFDYSKGRWSAITATTTIQKWTGGVLVDANISGTTDGADVISSGNTRKVIIKMCGFADTGAGKLIGPDGNEMDTESFLSDLIVFAGGGLTVAAGSPCTVGTGALLFRVVTQIYGRGIVKYGNTTQTYFPGGNPNGTNTGNGGTFKNVCDADGCIWLEVDLSCPVCADCDSTSLDGYTGTTIRKRYQELHSQRLSDVTKS